MVYMEGIRLNRVFRNFGLITKIGFILGIYDFRKCYLLNIFGFLFFEYGLFCISRFFWVVMGLCY